MTEKERAGMEKLRAAMAAEDRRLLEENPPETGEIFYSKEYLRTIAALKRKRGKSRLSVFSAFGKRVAAAVLLIVMISGCLMSISAVRKPIVDFFMTVHEKMIVIFFPEKDKAPETIETVYTLTYLPENCEWVTRSVCEKDVTTTWSSDFMTVTLVQETLDSRLYVNEEMARFETREIMGRKMAVIERFDLRLYFWNTDEYAYQLMVQGIFWEEDCMQMLRSVAIDPTIIIENGE